MSYRRVITLLITAELRLPDIEDAGRITELATVDGVTYVCVPDGVALPQPQPAEIAASICEVVLTEALRAAIRAESPHVRLINARVQEGIDGVSNFAQIDPALDATERAIAYREWGWAEEAKLGL